MMEQSAALFERAKKVLPGGVNSPVRAFRSVGLTPRFIARAQGAYLWDVDGSRYTDYVCSWGPMILGHNHPVIREAVERAVKDGRSFGAPTRREVEIAELMIGMVPNIEMVRMVNSGTEAVMSALRLARGATGRDKLIKFVGCYHGHSDCMLVNDGSSALAGGHPSSAGVPVGAARDTLTAQFNDLASVEALLEQNPGQVAAVIVEPVAANMGVVGPAPGFLAGLRALCDKAKERGEAIAAVFAGVSGGKATLAAVCSKAAQEKGLKAGVLVKEVAQLCGGNGGGRPDFAMAGAKDQSQLDDALAAVPELVKKQIG